MSESLFPDLGGSDHPAAATVIPCPKTPTNWIDLEYLYTDGTGVAGAAYVVQRPNRGRVGGAELARGTLDSQGRARASLPVGIEDVEVYFHDDPAGERYYEQDADRPVQEPEPGFFERLWDGIVDGAKYVGGALAGDFVDDPTTGQIVINTILTMIPLVDQVGDARDIVANLKKLIWDRRWNEAGVWLSVLLCLIGLIPELGSLAKGIIKVALDKAPKLAEMLKVFNRYVKGNGVRWLREFAQKLSTEHVTASAKTLDELLDRAAYYLRRSRDNRRTPAAFKPIIDQMLKNIDEVKRIAPQKLKEAADYVSQKVKKVLGDEPEVKPGKGKGEVQTRQVMAYEYQTLKVPGEPDPKRVQELRFNREQQKNDMSQGIGGARYEKATGRKISLPETDGADFIDPDLGPMQLKGPLVNKKTGEKLKINDNMVDGFAESAIDDIRYNTYSKAIVIDTYGMSPAQVDRLKQAINADITARPMDKLKPIIILE
jgi:hypothetical protein